MEEWSLICREYAPCLELPKLVLAFFRLLAEGTKFLGELAGELGCREQALLFVLLGMKTYFSGRSGLNPYFNSVERGERVSLETVTKTSKLLFCAICTTYDCSRHLVSELVLAYDYQYVCKYDEKVRSLRRNHDIFSIFRQLARIYSPEQQPAHSG